jgi:polynucleotide 5'-hydroxyl-kinase GRC3/NOL9
MSQSWAEEMADRITGAGAPLEGGYLFLGAADTGKTTLLSGLAARLATKRPVALVDADIGQSHIGPPATVGWTVIDGRPAACPEYLEAQGMAFVGDVTPVGHLLQLTAALMVCVEQAARAADVMLIDTPGLVSGGAACSLWWTIQRLLRPRRIIAVQRQNELADLLKGLQPEVSAIELIRTPPELRRKSPETRQEHRRGLFDRYFQNAATHTLDLSQLAVRTTHAMSPQDDVGRLGGLSGEAGQDIAICVIERWRPEEAKATVRAPRLDWQRVHCITVGDARIDARLEWS